MKKIRAFLIGLIFLVCISIPILNDKLAFIKDVESTENRRLADEPPFDIQRLDPYPVKYEAFYNDNFFFRSGLIQVFNALKFILFKRSPIPDQVIIGKDDWLFGAGYDFQSFTGKNRFTPQELKAFKQELEFRADYLSRLGCKFYMLVTPCKASIYEEKFALEHYRMTRETWGQQLINYLKNNSQVNTVDVFDSLLKYKNKGDLYYHLDNHWNDLGAFFTANEVVKNMRNDFPELKPLDISHYKINTTLTSDGNMKKMLGPLVKLNEMSVELVPLKPPSSNLVKKAGYPPVPGFAYPFDYETTAEKADTTLPGLLIISDSFGKALFPFVSEHFSRTVMIFDAWEYKLNEDIVRAEKPDVVLLVVNESLLRNILHFQPTRSIK